MYQPRDPLPADFAVPERQLACGLDYTLSKPLCADGKESGVLTPLIRSLIWKTTDEMPKTANEFSETNVTRWASGPVPFLLMIFMKRLFPKILLNICQWTGMYSMLIKSDHYFWAKWKVPDFSAMETQHACQMPP